MSPHSSCSLEPWKNLNRRLKSGNCTVRFGREDVLKLLCLEDSRQFQVWAFPGHLFLSFEESCDSTLLSFSTHVLNEPICECNHLDIKRGDGGAIVNIAEASTRDEARFWLTFETGLLQEWVYSTFHSCEKDANAHRGWALASETRFLRGDDNARAFSCGVVDNFLVWLRNDDLEDRGRTTKATSLWRLSLPTERGDGEEEGEITFGSPVCILSKLPPCRLKTFYGVAIVWTINCANAGGDFAFIFHPLSVVLRLVDLVHGVPREEDFEASNYAEWMRMRVLDVMREENERESNINESSHSALWRVSPLDFVFDARSKAFTMIQRNGAAYERGGGAEKSGWEGGAYGECWRKSAQLPLQMDESGPEDGQWEKNYSFAFAWIKSGRFLASIRDGAEVNVFDLTAHGQMVELNSQSTHAENATVAGKEMKLRFCLGRMPFPLILHSGVGLFKFAVTSTKSPNDVTSRGFTKVLSDVDSFVHGKGTVRKEELIDGIGELTSKPRPNAFLRCVKPDLEVFAETLGSFAEWRAKSCPSMAGEGMESVHRLPMSDRLLKEFCRRTSEGRMEEDAVRFLLHQLEFLSHSDPLQVISSLTSLFRKDHYTEVDKDNGNVATAIKNIFFASSSSTAYSSPPSPPSTMKSPCPLSSSLFQLLSSLCLIHRSTDFPSMMKDFFSRFLGEDADLDKMKAIQSLETLLPRLEDEGEFKAVQLLRIFLNEIVGRKPNEGEIEAGVDSSETMKSLIKAADWNACIEMLHACKNNESCNAVDYGALFDLLVDGLTSRSEVEDTRLLSELLRVLPDGYDIERVLTLIGSRDKRPCNNQLFCRKLGCDHVTVKDLRLRID